MLKMLTFLGKLILKEKLNALKEEEWVKVRGKEIAMIFQDPMTSLDPTMKIGMQIAEAILIHENISKQKP